MDFPLSQKQFQSLGQWQAWRLGIDLAEFAESGTLEQRMGQADLHAFFRCLYTALYEHPEAFGAPEKPYEGYRERSKEEEEEHHARNLALRKVIEDGMLEFLYQVGQAGEIDGQKLRLSSVDYDRLLKEKIKKAKTDKFLKGLEEAGLSLIKEKDGEVITSSPYSNLPAALGRFAKACGQNKEFGYTFFRRCDFGVFSGKEKPGIEDALRLVEPETWNEIIQTDTMLRERKYKQAFFTGHVQSGYRLRYSKKGDKIVYWLRVRNWSDLALDHSLRWPLETDLTQRLFAALDATQPGLSEQVFSGIRKCQHCYEPCLARKIVEYVGEKYECCGEACWNQIGTSPTDYEILWSVIEAIENNI
jgi:hypothetical protein